jgi:hypothetical protein
MARQRYNRPRRSPVQVSFVMDTGQLSRGQPW